MRHAKMTIKQNETSERDRGKERERERRGRGEGGRRGCKEGEKN